MNLSKLRAAASSESKKAKRFILNNEQVEDSFRADFQNTVFIMVRCRSLSYQSEIQFVIQPDNKPRDDEAGFVWLRFAGKPTMISVQQLYRNSDILVH